MTSPDLPALIAEVRRLDAEATKGPWYPGHNPESREPLDYIAEAYSYGPPGKVHLTCVPFGDKPIDDEALFTAITGNGPTSEQNAALIAHYRTAAPLLADECEKLRQAAADFDEASKLAAALMIECSRLQERVGVLEAGLNTARTDMIKGAAALVRLSGPDKLPEKWGEMVRRSQVVDIALRIKDAADKLITARAALEGTP